MLGGKDLSGKTVIVTGGYAGIGLETTRVLSEAGATVIVPARSAEKARANLEGFPRVELAALDLMNPESIDAFAESFLASGRPIDLLINNAGVMACPLSRDSRGNESQFSANHLGHFQLTLRLWPALIKAGGARVISLTSRGHRFSDVDFDDPNFDRRPYDKWKAYGQSKTANALFALGLDRRGEAHGVRAFSVHPGGILTDLTRHLTDDDLKGFDLSRRPDGSIVAGGGVRPPIQGRPAGRGDDDLVRDQPPARRHGRCLLRGLRHRRGHPRRYHAPDRRAPYACDPELAERLWALSEMRHRSEDLSAWRGGRSVIARLAVIR